MWKAIVFLAVFSVGHTNAQPCKYLVLKGGGIRGIAYAGAIKVLEEQGVVNDLEKIGGTSVGAITGALLAVGYSAKELQEKLFDLDIAVFNDGEFYFLGGQDRMRKNFGWYKGDELEHWIETQLQEKTGISGITFQQLHDRAQQNRKFKDLYVTTTNLSKQRLEIFSYETQPGMKVSVAVRASVSIPLYYTAVFTDSTGHRCAAPQPNGNVYVDGGLLANYPITMFNSATDNANNTINPQTLGLKLERPEQITHQQRNSGIAPYNIHTFNSYIGALYNMTMEQLSKRIPYDEEKKHTIYISTGNMNPKVRRITDAQKHLLCNNGEAAVYAFFKR